MSLKHSISVTVAPAWVMTSLRFDQTVRSLGDYEIHAPIRDLQSPRAGGYVTTSLQFMADAGFEVEASASRYSINENLLGVTISGSEIDEFQPPSADAWTMTSGRRDWPESSLQVSLGFDKGVAVSLDGEKLNGPENLAEIEYTAWRLRRWPPYLHR